jgi:DNA-binding CsgD family transcriptional regulator
MTSVFLATVMTGGFIARFAHQITDVSMGSRRVVFWAFTILFFFLVQSLPLFLEGARQISLEKGYLSATIYGSLCVVYAAGLVIRHRAKVPAVFGGSYPWYFLGLAILSVVSILNDLFHFGRTLHGPDLPFSPLFFLLVNLLVVFVCGRALLRPWPREAPTSGPDFGFTDRERELVPLLLEGLSNDEIGARLFISSHTVKNHITAIYRKAGVSNRLELLRKSSS